MLWASTRTIVHYRTFGTTAQARSARRSNEIFSALRDADNGLWSFAFSPWFPPRRITLLAIYSRAGTQRIWWRSSRGPLRQIAIFPGVPQMLATLSMPLSWLRGLVGSTAHGASSHSCCSIPLCRHHFARREIGNARHQHQTASGCEQSLMRCRCKRGAALGDRTRLAFQGCELEDTGREALIAKPTLLHPPLNVRSKPARVDLRNTLHMRGRLAKRTLVMAMHHISDAGCWHSCLLRRDCG